MNEMIKQAAAFLRERDNFDILTHDFPDGDTLGSGFALCIALQSIGKKARVITTGVPKDFIFLQEGIVPMSFDTQTVVSVDVADEKLLGKNREAYAGKIDLCIDHHRTNVIQAPLRLVDAEAAANCEILYYLLPELGAELTRGVRNNLYTGIATDTGCFRYTNTTAKTLRTAAALVELGCDTAYINKVMFETKTKKRMALEREILDTMEYCCGDRCAIIAATLDIQNRVGVCDGELEGLASIPRQIEGVEIGITMREKEPGVFKVSVRTDETRVNAATFCSQFGGGGHAAAAGCTVKGTLEQAKAQLEKAAGEALWTA